MQDPMAFLQDIKQKLAQECRAARLLEASYHMFEPLTPSQRKSEAYTNHLLACLHGPTEIH